jgi:N,N'-diacetyllegionaminate synthase
LIGIETGERCFVIAEAGVNHNGDLNRAFELVDAAVAAGADAVKFQTFVTDALVSKQSPQFQMLRELELSPEDFRELAQYCGRKNILFLSTPFDEASARLLDELDMRFFKVPSGELTNLRFIEYLCAFKKPLIVSTGMADVNEVQAAVDIIRNARVPFALLHCVSAYPADASATNLRAMQTLSRTFNVPVGFSDHSLGTAITLAAVALGAKIIEKHFTLSRDLPGPDHRASLERDELRRMIADIRAIESALGDGVKQPALIELETTKIARRSVVAARDIDAGTTIASEMLAIKRPGTGLAPAQLSSVIDRVARVDIAQGTPITGDMLR